MIEEIKYKGYTIEIYQDDDPDSPRNWGDFGTMYCWHRRYNLLGDEKPSTNYSIEDFKKEILKNKDYISLPLYLYDHSGLTMNTTGFSCPWDSGQVGWIFVSKENIRKEFSIKRCGRSVIIKAKALLSGEVKGYDQFLRGDIYGFIIKDHNNEEIDSCWGFFGNYEEYMIPECKLIINHHLDSQQEQLLLFEEMKVARGY